MLHLSKQIPWYVWHVVRRSIDSFDIDNRMNESIEVVDVPNSLWITSNNINISNVCVAIVSYNDYFVQTTHRYRMVELFNDQESLFNDQDY